MKIFGLVFLLGALLVEGCAWGARYRAALDEQLLTRASFDFDCPKEQLKVTQLSPTQSGVDGCGQRATYVWTQTAAATKTAGAQHEWIKNSETAR